MKQSWRPIGSIGVVLVAICLIIGWWQWWHRDNTSPATVTIYLKEQAWQVLVADTPTALTRGLSGVKQLSAHGMLFLLPQAGRPVFWMYKMQFPLDFIWINENHVVDLHTNVPAPKPGAAAAAIARVQPQVTATAVLEVPAGFVAQQQIKIGDKFSY